MDPHRPQYHFLPPANWINDPNGLIHWQGTYHLFYQHNPYAAYWGPMHWGHAASQDLVHWQHLPVALEPTPGSADQGGVWSGCAVNWDGIPAVIYTARDAEREAVNIAVSRDGLLTWEKISSNPVIAGPPAELDQTGFRDPYVWKDGAEWKMVIGSGLRDVGGTILLYRSADLLHWEYLGQMVSGDLNDREPVWTGEMWECPNFFPLGDRWVLMISPMGFNPSRSLYTLYFTGAFDGRRFTPSHLAKMDGGDFYFYAPQAFRDAQGRAITFGWSREARSGDASIEAGWAGVLTLPRLLDLHPDGTLRSRPAPEVECLRGRSWTWENLRLEPLPAQRTMLPLEGIAGEALELDITFDLSQPGDGEVGVLVRRSPGGEEQTEIRYERVSGRLVVDTLRSSLGRGLDPGVYELPLELSDDATLNLRVFIDHSILEVFANERAVITARMYPSRPDSTGLALVASGRPAVVSCLKAWEMQPA